MRCGAASSPPESRTARLAAATASWLTRSTPGSCSLVNQCDSSNSTVAAAAGLASSGNTACTADSPRSSASNMRSGSSPCGEMMPMPVTATISSAVRTRALSVLPAQRVSSGLLGAQAVDQVGEAGQGFDARVLFGQGEAEAVFHLEQKLRDGQRIEALLAHGLMRVERARLNVVLLANHVLQVAKRTHPGASLRHGRVRHGLHAHRLPVHQVVMISPRVCARPTAARAGQTPWPAASRPRRPTIHAAWWPTSTTRSANTTARW